jgi:hypothetical protein
MLRQQANAAFARRAYGEAIGAFGGRGGGVCVFWALSFFARFPKAVGYIYAVCVWCLRFGFGCLSLLYVRMR